VAPARLRPRAKFLALAAAAAFAAVWMAEDALDGGDWTEPLMQTVGFTALAAGFGSLIGLVATGGPRDWLRRLFTLRVLRFIGRYSYALYLFHVPVRRFVRDYYFPVAEFQTWLGSPLPGQLLFYVVATAPALALAWASWHVLEQPCLGLKRFFPYGSGPDVGRGDASRGPGGGSRPA
jgi:peptidoglycan/LPS O-acetylase OafA/YrhL